MKYIDLTNQKFGNLLVIEKDSTKNSRTQLYWICKCNCGNIKSIRSDCLRLRNYTHCGCITELIHINDKFGLLTTKNKGKKGKRNVQYWVCQCECGNTKEVLSSQLLNGRTKSCGCLVKSFNRYKNPNQIGEIRPYFWEHIKRGAKSRNIDFLITPEDIWELWLLQEGKCAYSKIKLELPKNSKDKAKTSASLDRIDSNKGYVKGNIQWIHKDINKMKNNFSEQYFLYLCNEISQNFH